MWHHTHRVVTGTPIILITISAFSISFLPSSQLIPFEFLNVNKKCSSYSETNNLFFILLFLNWDKKMSPLQCHARPLFCIHHVKYHNGVFWWQKKMQWNYLKMTLQHRKEKKKLQYFLTFYRINLFIGLRSE